MFMLINARLVKAFQYFITDRSKAVLLLWFILIVIVRPLSVCLRLLVCLLQFRIAWWPSVGKVVSSWLSACTVLLYFVLSVCVPFPFGVWGGMWNAIRLYRLLFIAFRLLCIPHTIHTKLTKALF